MEKISFVAQKLLSAEGNIESAFEKFLPVANKMLFVTEMKLQPKQKMLSGSKSPLSAMEKIFLSLIKCSS